MIATTLARQTGLADRKYLSSHNPVYMGGRDERKGEIFLASFETMMNQIQYPSPLAISSTSGNLTLLPRICPRLNSSTSGTSENSSKDVKLTRRRSHRPRGCRGGSNRRRHKNKGNDTKSSHGNKILPEKYGQGGKPGQKLYQRRQSTLTLLSGQGNAPHKNKVIYGNGDENECILLQESLSSSLSGTESYEDGHSLNESAGFIQTSFSDTSSEVGVDIPYSKTSDIDLGRDEKILPPLPSTVNIAEHHEITSFGPNPYALKPTGNLPHHHFPTKPQGDYYTDPGHFMLNGAKQILPHTFACSFPSMNYSLEERAWSTSAFPHDSRRMGPPPSRSLETHNIPAKQFFLTVDGSVGPIHSGCENEYRAERLDFQRQSVEGGSLFLTSPRSFLMGKRSNGCLQK